MAVEQQVGRRQQGGVLHLGGGGGQDPAGRLGAGAELGDGVHGHPGSVRARRTAGSQHRRLPGGRLSPWARPGARLATADDVDGMAEALRLAFDDDPVMQWLFGDEPAPADASTPTVLPPRRRPHLRHDQRVHARRPRRAPPTGTRPGTGRPRSSTSSAWPRSMIARDRHAASCNALRGLSRDGEGPRPSTPSTTTSRCSAPRPDRQGSGIGSALMAPVLAHAATRRDRRLPRELEGVEHPLLPAARLRGGRRGGLPQWRTHAVADVARSATARPDERIARRTEPTVHRGRQPRPSRRSAAVWRG